MSLRAIARLLIAYALALGVLCLAMHEHATLRELAPAERRVIASHWANGRLVTRTASKLGEAPDTASGLAGSVVHETTIADGPLSLDARTFPFALVPGRDGLFAELGDKTAWLTVDDLLAAQPV